MLDGLDLGRELDDPMLALLDHRARAFRGRLRLARRALRVLELGLRRREIGLHGRAPCMRLAQGLVERRDLARKRLHPRLDLEGLRLARRPERFGGRRARGRAAGDLPVAEPLDQRIALDDLAAQRRDSVAVLLRLAGESLGLGAPEVHLFLRELLGAGFGDLELLAKLRDLGAFGLEPSLTPRGPFGFNHGVHGRLLQTWISCTGT